MAGALCSAGVFLCTKDDSLTTDGVTTKAAPRDNVVFEAGELINAKGKDRVLIVRQADAKMPADLGGDIYASLTNASGIASVKGAIRRFVRSL